MKYIIYIYTHNIFSILCVYKVCMLELYIHLTIGLYHRYKPHSHYVCIVQCIDPNMDYFNAINSRMTPLSFCGPMQLVTNCPSLGYSYSGQWSFGAGF